MPVISRAFTSGIISKIVFIGSSLWCLWWKWGWFFYIINLITPGFKLTSIIHLLHIYISIKIALKFCFLKVSQELCQGNYLCYGALRVKNTIFKSGCWLTCFTLSSWYKSAKKHFHYNYNYKYNWAFQGSKFTDVHQTELLQRRNKAFTFPAKVT